VATLVLIFQETLGKLFWDIIIFPFWWYTFGVFGRLQWFVEQIKAETESLSLNLWIKNLFVPMFGQYDKAGRIISFFMRLIQIIFRFVFLILWIVLLIILFMAWLVLPIIVVYGLITGNFLVVDNEIVVNFIKKLFSY